MRLCLIGKFPPIQGGVSATTYRLAHGLARRGHEVHVVTNAREVEAPYRIQMRPEDDAQCEARFEEGSVTLHWTPPASQEQWHVPWHNPFVTKLAGLAADVVQAHRLECILSYYLEPYGVAGRLAADITGRPHIVKTAGSDAGRLWHQPHFQPVYDHVFRGAGAVIAGGPLAAKLIELGIEPGRILPDCGPHVPLDAFHPDGLALDLHDWRPEGSRHPGTPSPVVGIFGKLGPHKGVQALLPALRSCINSDRPVRLAAMMHGHRAAEEAFDRQIEELDLGPWLHRIPFLPYWRVPEFLRACDVVCCLEQSFPIRAHAPVIAQEAMATGARVMMSREVAVKQHLRHLLVHGFNAFVVRDSDDPAEIAACLPAAAYHADGSGIGRRAREYVQAAQAEIRFFERYEEAMEIATDRVKPASRQRPASRSDLRQHGLYHLLQKIQRRILAVETMSGAMAKSAEPESGEWYRSLLDGHNDRTDPVVAGLARFALQLLAARCTDRGEDDLFFRFDAGPGGWRSDETGRYVPTLSPAAIVEDYPFNPLVELREADSGLSDEDGGRPTTVVALPMGSDLLLRLYAFDGSSQRFLRHCDSRSTVAAIARRIIENGEAKNGDEVVEATAALATELFGLGVLHLSRPTVSDP